MTELDKNHAHDDQYGFSRVPESIDRIQYGRFRNVYLYITEECQLRCGHCYMGDRLDRGLTMPFSEVYNTLVFWRKMGGSKLSLLGGEPTLHPDFSQIVEVSHAIGYEKVILNTHGLRSAARVLANFKPTDFSYIQVSLDGGSPATHDQVRGRGTFTAAWKSTKDFARRGFDTRVICTVNRANIEDCMTLIDLAEAAGVRLVKYHVFSGIGLGRKNDEWLLSPIEWVEFCERLEIKGQRSTVQVWYQPTYVRRSQIDRFFIEGYRGCIGRTLDRISLFPDGRGYVCSYLFDTNLNYVTVKDGRVELNRENNEFDLFTGVLQKPSCSSCKEPKACSGGCPAESLVMGGASCAAFDEIVPICRLWKSKMVGSDGLRELD